MTHPRPLYCALCDSEVRAFCADLSRCAPMQQRLALAAPEDPAASWGCVVGLLLGLVGWGVLIGLLSALAHLLGGR